MTKIEITIGYKGLSADAVDFSGPTCNEEVRKLLANVAIENTGSDGTKPEYYNMETISLEE
jgi:hypothetical protein